MTVALTLTTPLTADLDEVMSTLVTSGVGAVRIPVSWRTAEPQHGRFDWAPYDATITAAHARGLGVMVAVADTPGWAIVGSRGRVSDPPPAKPAHFGEFMSALAQRYRGAVSAWEIWYAVNSPRHFGSTNPAAYCAMLASASRQLRAVTPNAAIISAPTVEGTDSDSVMPPGLFVNLLYHCVADDFDGIGMDVSVGGGRSNFTEAVDDLNVVGTAIERSAHRDRKVWFTRLAVPTVPAPGGVTPAVQSKRLVDAVLYLRRRHEAQMIGIYQFADVANSVTSDGNSGVVNSSLRPKPAWSGLLGLPRS